MRINRSNDVMSSVVVKQPEIGSITIESKCDESNDSPRQEFFPQSIIVRSDETVDTDGVYLLSVIPSEIGTPPEAVTTPDSSL